MLAYLAEAMQERNAHLVGAGQNTLLDGRVVEVDRRAQGARRIVLQGQRRRVARQHVNKLEPRVQR